MHLASAIKGDESRARLARFYIERLLPEHAALVAQVRSGAAAVTDITADDLAA